MPEAAELTQPINKEPEKNSQGKLSEPTAASQPERPAFINRLSEIRSSNQTNVQRLNILFGNLDERPLYNVKSEDDSFPGYKQNKTIRRPEKLEMRPIEGVSTNQTTIKEASQIRNKILMEVLDLRQSINPQEESKRALERVLKELDEAKGIRKITTLFRRKKIIKQLTVVQQEIDSLNSQRDSKKDLIEKLWAQERLARSTYNNEAIADIRKAVTGAESKYDELAEEVFEDGTILSEIADIYIQRNLAPEFEKLAKERGLSKSKKAEFYTLVRALVNNKKEIFQNGRALDVFLNENRLFSDLMHNLIPLREGLGTKIITLLIKEMAVEDIEAIKTSAEGALDILSLSQVRDFGNRWKYTNTDTSLRIPDMDFWDAVKASPAAIGAFGEVIGKLDRQFYGIIMSDALSDLKGNYISNLPHYPTPECVRNLALLAGADGKGYRTIHANGALTKLAKRNNWPHILDETVKAYPSLANARPILEKWNFTEFSNNENLKKTIGQLAFDIWESNPEDNRISKLAIESMGNQALISILVKKGLISQEHADKYLQAEVALMKASKEIRAQIRKGNNLGYISEKDFNHTLRNHFIPLLTGDDDGGLAPEHQRLTILGRFEALSNAIIRNKNNNEALYFLTRKEVSDRLEGEFDDDKIDIFLNASKNFPALLNQPQLLEFFCNHFEGQETVDYFRNMSQAYQENAILINLISLVGQGKLSRERSLILATKPDFKLIEETPLFHLGKAFPEAFLETDEGLAVLTHLLSDGHIFSIDANLNQRFGEIIGRLERKPRKISSVQLVKSLFSQQVKLFDELLSSENEIVPNEKNWQLLLTSYIRIQAENNLPNLSNTSTERIKSLFENSEVRNLCLNGIRNEWLAYLKTGTGQGVPFSLKFMTEFINYCEGAGPLTQIESLSNFILSFEEALSNTSTFQKTRQEIFGGIGAMEERFAKERWSNEDRTDFYNVSRDILSASPSLFSDYLALFGRLTPAQLKLFSQTIYPLYRAKFALLEQKDKQGRSTFDKSQLLAIRKEIRGFSDSFSSENAFELKKKKLAEDIKILFQNRFGIIKTPQEFNEDQMRSLTNVSIYLANLRDRSPKSETLLGFYLALMINNSWDKLRSGQPIDPTEFMTTEKSAVISKILQDRDKLNAISHEVLGLKPEDIPIFASLLQQETQNLVTGSIETIDVKLTNIILNLKSLEDPDLYPDKLDKDKMKILLNWGNKRLSAVVAKMYQSLANPKAQMQFSEEEEQVKSEVSSIITQSGLNLTPQTLKEHFQDGIKPLATVFNLINFVKETGAEEEVDLLRNSLNPSNQIIEIFKRLGEDFKPSSGAMALSSDLNYLDNLVVKKADQLKPEEKAILTAYTGQIRTQIIKLEEIYTQIKNKFGSLRQGSHAAKNPLLEEKLKDIDRIIYSQNTEQAITSTATNNLNTIMENIRECLSCTRSGANNDTNLTFGDMNKFYLYSQSESQEKGSISDQIVFLEPVKRQAGEEMAFVLDRIYGANTPTVLRNQIEAVLKKVRLIKQKFPDIHLSVFVTKAAMLTGGTSPQMLLANLLSEKIPAQQESLTVNVTPSAFADHYIEFAGDARKPGERTVEGIRIS